MTAEEFFKKKGLYSDDTEYSKLFWDELMDIAEAYAEHRTKEIQEEERSKYKALAKLYKLQEQEIKELEDKLELCRYRNRQLQLKN